MAPEVKFTSFGIPYLVEFANVTFRRKKRNSALPPPIPPKTQLYPSHSNDSDWTFASTSSDTLAYPTVDGSESEGRAMYIRFASEGPNAPVPGPPLSERRMDQLKRRLARAVLAVGMDPTPESDTSEPVEKRAMKSSLHSVSENGSLYRGTYGQVMEALKSAGLTSTSCDEYSLPNATRLGVMFVLRKTEYGGVELCRLTLLA